MSVDEPADIIDQVVAGFRAELPEIDPLTLETVCRLIVAGKGLEQAAASMLKHFKVNYSDFDVLGMLRSAGPPYELTPAELLRFTMITSGAMTNCLDRLEKAALVKRRMSEHDRRVRVISLTPKGKKTIEQAMKMRFDAAAATFADFSRADLGDLNAYLRRIQGKPE